MRRPQWLDPRSRAYRWITGVAVAITALAVIAAFFLDEPLRRLVERQMNERLMGYTATVGRLDFHPLTFALDLHDVVLVQKANPDPPVMRIERLSANVQWSALVRLRLVADFDLVRPTLYIDKQHLEAEARDDVPVKDHGWQEALQAIYPLKINEFTIRDGDLTYVETTRAEPLRVTKLQVVAQDIRNIRSDPGDYPSPIEATAVIFDRGRLLIKGHADFLATPHAGVKGRIELAEIGLDYFKPVLARYNLVVSRGVVGGRGLVEYAPAFKKVDLEELRVDGLQAEYLYRKRAAAGAKAAARKTAEAAKEVSNDPDVVLHAREVRMTDATVGFVNKDASPEYRVFLSNTDLTIENFSNQKAEGLGHAKLTGRFMGSGRTVVDLVLRPETHGPDFNLDLKIENTDLRAMNDLLRAHAKVDVVSGVFSVYSEIAVKNARIEGYLKPLFKDLEVYDKDQDEGKTLGQKLKEKAADVVGKVFKNRPRDEVATLTKVAGRLDDPKASVWQVLINLVRNAFFRAILPGFEREAGRGGRG